MMTITENILLGKLVDTYPLTSKVLHKHGLDFCCGGRKSLAEACEASGIDLDVILSELKPSLTPSPKRAWSDATTEELVAHILDEYHAPLPEFLSHLEMLVSRVVDVHGNKDPDRLLSLKDAIFGLSQELRGHMMKEERILFPWILSEQQPPPAAPIEVMLSEHEDAGAFLQDIAALTDNFSAPSGACRTWRTLYSGLQHLDEELRVHIHLENNILFPRALR